MKDFFSRLTDVAMPIGVVLVFAILMVFCEMLIRVTYPEALDEGCFSRSLFGHSQGVDVSVCRKWVYDYQTLIAGVLAVGAGTVTVFTYIVLDHMAGYRHSQLLALNIRPEALIIDRALSLFEKFSGDVKLLSIENGCGITDPSGADLGSQMTAFQDSLLKASSPLTGDDWTHARRLMTGEQARAYDDLLECIREIRIAGEGALALLNPRGPGVSQPAEVELAPSPLVVWSRVDECLEKFEIEVKTLPKRVEIFGQIMREWHRSYVIALS